MREDKSKEERPLEGEGRREKEKIEERGGGVEKG